MLVGAIVPATVESDSRFSRFSRLGLNLRRQRRAPGNRAVPRARDPSAIQSRVMIQRSMVVYGLAANFFHAVWLISSYFSSRVDLTRPTREPGDTRSYLSRRADLTRSPKNLFGEHKAARNGVMPVSSNNKRRASMLPLHDITRADMTPLRRHCDRPWLWISMPSWAIDSRSHQSARVELRISRGHCTGTRRPGGMGCGFNSSAAVGACLWLPEDRSLIAWKSVFISDPTIEKTFGRSVQNAINHRAEREIGDRGERI
jgi:hypothetical protein